MEQYIFAPTVCGAELEEELAAAQRPEGNFTEDPSVGPDPRGTFSGDPGGDGAKGAAHTAHCGRLLYVIGHFKPSAAAPCAEERLVPPSGGWNVAKYERPCGSERAGRF